MKAIYSKGEGCSTYILRRGRRIVIFRETVVGAEGEGERMSSRLPTERRAESGSISRP